MLACLYCELCTSSAACSKCMGGDHILLQVFFININVLLFMRHAYLLFVYIVHVMSMEQDSWHSSYVDMRVFTRVQFQCLVRSC